MLGGSGDVTFGEAMELAVTGSPMQAADPSSLVELPGTVRGPVVFVLVFLLGLAIAWRFESKLARSIEATMDRPLAAVVYGAAALGVLLFASTYLANQAAQLPALGRNSGALGLAVGGLLIVGTSSLGFAVVGSVIVELWRGQEGHAGLVVGASIAGVAASIDPLVGAILWFVVVSTGIGGTVREWVNASEDAGVADIGRN